MFTARTTSKSIVALFGAVALTLMTLGSALAAAPPVISDTPLFLNQSAPPLNMLVLSRDHRLYYEAYNDASDLNGDDVLDVGYKPKQIDYYGYFESTQCYTYDTGTGIFVPAGAAGTYKTCSGKWSGDWLNYVTTSRIDALRKVLYGGTRYIDTATDTVLQRAYIPQDAHSWGKEYCRGNTDYDITQYTTLPQPTGSGTTRCHLFASTSVASDPDEPNTLTNRALRGIPVPKLRVVESRNNRIWDWLSKERPVAHTSIIGADTSAPTIKDYTVRVRVCSSGSYNSLSPSNNCKMYGSNAKPTGLLQDYGENDSMYFGLISGSYGKPHDGGVLRKAVASIKNEMDTSTGVFVYDQNPPGIISTIDRLRIMGFNRDSNGGGQYACGWITTSSDANGNCSMWGNPTAEMMYEALRYFAGKSAPTDAYYSSANNSEETTLGLKVATWDSNTNPYRSGGFPVCAKPFQTVISDINPSYDSDSLPGSAFKTFSGDLTGMNVATDGQTIWNNDVGGSAKYFIGESNGTYDGAPTVKTVSSFGNIRGLSPEAPAKEGSYYAASVAYYGNRTDVSSSAAGMQKPQTFAVALASPLPRIEIPVGGGKKITLVPFAKTVQADGGMSSAQGSYQPTNQIVDFYVDSLTSTSGTFRVNFEDVEQGADHDMDAIATYKYTVNADNTVKIELTSDYAAGGYIQHMGYVISGTTKDGTYLEVRDKDTNEADDVRYFLDTKPTATSSPDPNWNSGGKLPLTASRTFSPGTGTAAGFLKDPLWYAAKWGGFNDSNKNDIPDLREEWAQNANVGDTDPDPDNYFLVTNALNLRAQLGKAFNDILDRSGSASSASVSSGSISDDTRVYQATFDSRFWSGHMLAYSVGTGSGTLAEGALGGAVWDAATQMPVPGSRKILTIKEPATTGAADGLIPGSRAVPFRWTNIGSKRQDLLKTPSLDSLGEKRLDFLRGDRSNEKPSGVFRRRITVLGDIVNSAPVFVGVPSSRYPDSLESVSYSSFVTANTNRKKVVYAGANDGMMHAFDAETGGELFAYVPHGVFRNLYRLADPAYTHLFYADGTPTVVDAFFSSPTNAWRTVLVAGLNKGGQSVYALDVTNPAAISESSAASTVLWEFTDQKDKDLGYTYSRPAIVKLQNGVWAAIFGNGYNNTEADGFQSTSGDAVLYVVNIKTGELITKLDTGVGLTDPASNSRPNGLATPAPIDQDGDGLIDTVYAGDLFGNMWKFDLSSKVNTNDWKVAFNNKPLFTAKDASNNRQPITERPQVARGPNGQGFVVLFGTGKFMESADRLVPASPRPQSFYGIFDGTPPSVTYPVTRDTLLQQSVVLETAYGYTDPGGTARSTLVRVTSNNQRTSAHRGWYIDLLKPPGLPTGYQGEMQVTNPVLRNGRVIFTTLIPDSDICAYGGRSWLMDMDALSGSRLAYSPFDLNRDSEYNATDYVELDGVKVAVTGRGSDSILTQPAFLSGTLGDYAYTSSSGSNTDDSTIGVEGSNSGPSGRGRQSWRQLR